jgi:MoaA/NifB/PqqE/SkfB family radical SAM enzyme
MKIIKFYEQGWNFNQLLVQWNLGNTCNYTCEYCPPYLHNGDRAWPDISKVKSFLSRLKQENPTKNISVEFLGGEVTLWTEFIDLMKFCKDNKFRSLVLSNGSRTTRYWKELSPYLDKIILTYHPHTTKPSHYEKIIKICIDNNVETISHLSLIDTMFETITAYKEILVGKFPGLTVDNVMMMDKLNQKSFNGYFYNYTEQQIQFLSKPINNNTNDYGYIAEYDNGEIIKYSLNQVKSENLNSFKGFTCDPGLGMIHIDFAGNASTSLCGIKPRVNIYTEELDKLFLDTICTLDRCHNPSDIRVYKTNE